MFTWNYWRIVDIRHPIWRHLMCVHRNETSWFPERHTRAFVYTGVNTHACPRYSRIHAISSRAPWKIKVTRARYFIVDVWAAAKRLQIRRSERICERKWANRERAVHRCRANPHKQRGCAATLRVATHSCPLIVINWSSLFNRFLQKLIINVFWQ